MSIYEHTHLVGGPTADYWDRDPQRLAFVLARYKFVARMFEGKHRVLEVGCADGFGSRIVRQRVGHLTAVDIEAKSLITANERQSRTWPVEFVLHDMLKHSLEMFDFDAAYALDVLEHIYPQDEFRFLQSMRRSAPVVIIGMPSLESQKYASALSRAGHVNCKTGEELRASVQKLWRHTFLFSMSDEVVHTGFAPMAHYLLALGVA